MRTQVRRAVAARLGLIVVLSMLLQTWMPSIDVRAQDSGATTFTVASVSGTVVVKRADGSGETARPGTVLRPGDELASVGRSEVTVNLSSGQSNVSGQAGGGASLILFSNTTIGVRDSSGAAGRSGGSGGGGFFIADIASGVVLARTPPTGSSTIQITNEHAGAVAQLNRGGMAVATDTDTGTIAVACDGSAAEVAFPYTDMRVPCESNVVRTLSNTNAIDDSRRDDDSPVNAVVHAAAQTAVQGTGNQGTGVVSPQAGSGKKEREKEEDSKPQPPADAVGSASHAGPFNFFGTCATVTPVQTCTISSSSLPGAQIGGNISVTTQLKNPSTLAIVTETFACGPITSSTSVNCQHASSNYIFQDGTISLTVPLAGGGSSVVNLFWTCIPPKSTGAIC